MEKEGFIKKFMQKRPLLYCTLVLALISAVCGTLLGLGNKFLYVEKDSSGSLGIIFNVLTGTKEHTVIFDKNTADEFAVGAEKIKIEKSKREEAKVEAAYRIENEGKTYILIMASGKARNAADGQLKVITAYIADPAGKPESDKIAGSRPYEAPSSEYKNAYNKTFFDSFSGKTADSGVKLSDTDGYSGATVTATGLVEAVNNASAFYKLYRGNLMGVADTPLVKAVKKAYKFAANATEIAFAGLPAGVKLYMTNDGLPVFDVAADGYSIVLSFAEKHGYLGGAAVYNKDGGDVNEALTAAAEKAAGENPLAQGFAAKLGSGAAVEGMADLIIGAYDFFNANRLDILKKNNTFDAALITGLNKIANKALPASAAFEYMPVLGLVSADGATSLNTVKYGDNYYYSAYEIDNGDYITLTVGTEGEEGDVLSMTYIKSASNEMTEFFMYKATNEVGYPVYLDSLFFIKDTYRGMLGPITAGNYKDLNDAKGNTSAGSVVSGDYTGSVTKSHSAIADCLVKAASVYRIIAEIA